MEFSIQRLAMIIPQGILALFEIQIIVVFNFSYRLFIGVLVMTVVSDAYVLRTGDYSIYRALFYFAVLVLYGAILLFLRQFDPEINNKEVFTQNDTIIEVCRIVFYGFFLSTLLTFFAGIGYILFLATCIYGIYRLAIMDKNSFEYIDEQLHEYLLSVFAAPFAIFVVVVLIYLTPLGSGLIHADLDLLVVNSLALIFLSSFYIYVIAQIRVMIAKFIEIKS